MGKCRCTHIQFLPECFVTESEQVEEAYENMVARRVAEYVAQGRQQLLSCELTQV